MKYVLLNQILACSLIEKVKSPKSAYYIPLYIANTQKISKNINSFSVT